MNKKYSNVILECINNLKFSYTILWSIFHVGAKQINDLSQISELS